MTAERLGACGLQARIVSERLNRRKIDLIPEPDWEDPLKAMIAELVAAVERGLTAAGIAGLPEAVDIARAAAAELGLADPRVTSDAKHVEIGLTDRSDSGRWIMRWMWQRGIAPEQVLIAGDDLGPLGGLPGSDSLLLRGGGARATAVSVGVEPGGVPDNVVSVGGGPQAFIAVLEDRLAERVAPRPPPPAGSAQAQRGAGHARSLHQLRSRARPRSQPRKRHRPRPRCAAGVARQRRACPSARSWPCLSRPCLASAITSLGTEREWRPVKSGAH
jgi:hypothetical protein